MAEKHTGKLVKHKRRPMCDTQMEQYMAAATLTGQDVVDYRAERQTGTVDVHIGANSRVHSRLNR